MWRKWTDAGRGCAPSVCIAGSIPAIHARASHFSKSPMAWGSSIAASEKTGVKVCDKKVVF